MRLIVTADWHLDAVTAGVSRLPDLELAARQVAEFAVRRYVEDVHTVFVFGGDLTDPDPPRCWRAVAAAAGIARYLFEHGVTSYWMTGNHDVLEDGHGSHTLLTLASIGRPDRCRVIDAPTAVLLPDARELVLLPFVARSRGYDPEEAVRRLAGPDTAAVVGHLMLEGIGPGSETTDFARGRDVFFPIDAAREVAPEAVLVNGHYHRRQTYRGVEVPGALARLTRTDVGITPSFLEVVL
jgi:DNA repair exonuclease SbcCD nuclease subunit